MCDAFDPCGEADDLVNSADPRERARACYETAVAILDTQRFELARERYRFAAAVIAEQGGHAARCAIAQVAARSGHGVKHTLELFNLVAAIQQGMTLGEYLEFDSAASWLQRCGAKS